MVANNWFDDLPVIGGMPPDEAFAKLREVEEIDENLDSAPLSGGVLGASEIIDEWWQLLDKPWKHTAHTFGYLPPLSETVPLTIQHVSNISPDSTLKNARIKITLDRLRIADYPGGGTHLILFDFYAQNQVKDHAEDLHFNITSKVRQGEHAAILGVPIFLGLNVGTEGVVFRCYTVNVRNDADEAFLGFLESDTFKSGLKLISTLQPAIAPLSSMAYNLTKVIAKRHRNIGVQKFELGLDFSSIATRARLAEGSYIAVQIPENSQSVWNWNQWMYYPTTGQIFSRENPNQLISYNYLIFSISKHEDV